MWRWADVASLWLHQGNHFILFLDVVETGTVGEPPLELLQLVFHCIKPCWSGGDNMMVDYLLFHDCLVSGTNIGRSGQELSNATKVSDGCSPWLVNQPSLKTCCHLSSWHDRTCFWSETNTEISCQLLPDIGKSGERQMYLFKGSWPSSDLLLFYSLYASPDPWWLSSACLPIISDSFWSPCQRLFTIGQAWCQFLTNIPACQQNILKEWTWTNANNRVTTLVLAASFTYQRDPQRHEREDNEGSKYPENNNV